MTVILRFLSGFLVLLYMFLIDNVSMDKLANQKTTINLT